MTPKEDSQNKLEFNSAQLRTQLGLNLVEIGSVESGKYRSDSVESDKLESVVVNLAELNLIKLNMTRVESEIIVHASIWPNFSPGPATSRSGTVIGNSVCLCVCLSVCPWLLL